MTDSHPLDTVLDAMWPAALQLVGAVRARDPEWVASLTRDLTHEQKMGLLIAVAALVPEDQNADQLALWSHGPAVTDEVYGQLVVEELGVPMKACSLCRERQPDRNFYPAPTPANPGRRKARCVDCCAKTARERSAARAAAPAEAVQSTTGEAVKAA